MTWQTGGAGRGARPFNDETITKVQLGDVVGTFKSLTTVEYVRGVRSGGWTPFHGRLWQRNFYEHIVRTDESLEKIHQYILDNPANWLHDRENPRNNPIVQVPP